MSTRLKSYIKGLAWKRAAEVEVSGEASNQHEFNGVTALKALLGDKPRRGLKAVFIRLEDDPDRGVSCQGGLSWYDAREADPLRTEWRLYYTPNEVLRRTDPGDTVLLIHRYDDTLVCVTVAGGSSADAQLRWIFGLDEEGSRFQVLDGRDLERRKASTLVQPLLDLLGLTRPLSDYRSDIAKEAVNRFPAGFPTSAELSEFGREVAETHDNPDADELLVRWMEAEEIAFRAIEQQLVLERLQAGFGSDPAAVDAFISLSLSVHNRRKSRAGRALENHVAAMLERRRIPYSQNSVTESKFKPDFVVPGIAQYRDPDFDAARLRMIGVKTTCKDRWRQVLSEARRIDLKHLLTLEPAISEGQTDQMRAERVQLVVPRSLHDSYCEAQREWLWDVERLLTELEALC